MSQPLASAGALSHAQIRMIMFGIVLAMLLAALDQTIVATALPTIGREVNDVRNLSWVISAYLVTSTAVTPLYGKLSDIHGRRSMLLLAIAVFLGGSVAAALSRNIFVLIAARAVQGLGGGGLISLAQTIVGDLIVPRERGKYQAYFASVFVTASVAGPVLGGFFAEYLHWSFIFWINLPLGLAAYAMTNRVLKLLPRHDRPHRVDAVGALLMVIATVALLLMLTWGGATYPWASAPIIGLAGLSLAAWVLFGIRLATAPEPFVPLSVLANPVVRDGVIATVFTVGAMIGLTVFIPLYFEAVFGLTAGQSGVGLIAFMGGTVVGATAAGRVMMYFARYKWAPVLGLAISTARLGGPGGLADVVLVDVGRGCVCGGRIWTGHDLPGHNDVYPERRAATPDRHGDGAPEFLPLARRRHPGRRLQRGLPGVGGSARRPVDPGAGAGGCSGRHGLRPHVSRRLHDRSGRLCAGASQA